MQITTKNTKMRRFCFSLVLGLQLLGCSSKNTEPEKTPILSAPLTTELELIERGMANYDRGYFSLSRETWSELLEGYPNSYYSVLAELKIADSYFYAGSYDEALAAYEEFLRLHRGHEALAYVYFQIANTHLQRYRGTKRDQTPLRSAMAGFEKLLEQFPDNLYSALSKEKIRECRALLAEHELIVADFYHRQGFDEAYQRRFDLAQKQFADVLPSAREGLEEAGIELDPSLMETTAGMPNVPQMLLAAIPANLAEENSNQSQAWVSDSASSANSETAVAGVGLVDSNSSSSFDTALKALSCDETEDYYVVVAHFSETLESDNQENPGSALGQFAFRLRNTASPLANRELDCDFGGRKARFRETAENSLIQASLDLPAEARVKSFVLNRPDRVVLLVDKRSL